MKTDEFETILRQTLEDGRLSRSERKAVAAVLDDENLDRNALRSLRSVALGVAREAIRDGRDDETATWLYDVLNLLTPPPLAEVRAEALFSPGDACLKRIVGLIRGARKHVEACVYTITDDRIAEALLDAHRRHVDVRVLSDAVKTMDPGSDIRRMAAEGVAVALDTPDKYMHHKFAVFDRRTLVTGSYNWTRAAARANHQNLIVSSDPRLVTAFTEEFAKLWERYAKT